MKIFETERLKVRQYEFTEGDRENFFRLNGDEEVMRYIRTAKSRKECDDFLKEVITSYSDNEKIGRWAAEDKLTGNFIGSFAVIPVDKSEKIQLGYALLKENWGKGYATELTRAGIHYVFHTVGLEEVYAITEALNIPSQQVLLKCGFRENERRKEGDKEIIEFILFPDNQYTPV